MYKKGFSVMILVVSFIALVGCTIVMQEDQNDGNNNTSQEHIEEPVTEVDEIKEQIENMSLEEKIGQMVVVGLDGNTLDNNAIEMINNFHIGGFILFKKIWKTYSKF